MSDLVVFMNVTLDGVIQAPARADEDTRDGFSHGGWSTPYADGSVGRIASERMSDTQALVLGRRTYEDILPYWNRTGGPFKQMLNDATKYVASTTLHEPLPWPNSRVLGEPVTDGVADLRKESGGDLVVLGSGELVRSLMGRDLIDRYVLLIHPLVLGEGQRLYPDGAPASAMRLTDSTTTPTGLVIATYQVH
jgi:dihydrofolate reductase